jgi:hypothetical protein
MTTRESISNALFDLLAGAVFVTLTSQGQEVSFSITGRRFRQFSDISGAQQIAFFLIEPKEKHKRGDLITPPVRDIMYEAYIFIGDGVNPAASVTPITTVNNILDSIDPAQGGVLKPEAMSNRQTLGGLAHDCFIEGDIDKVPGDLDGQGVLIIPITVIMP